MVMTEREKELLEAVRVFIGSFPECKRGRMIDELIRKVKGQYTEDEWKEQKISEILRKNQV